MKVVLLGLVALIGVFALSESLTCNTCSLGLIGFCFNPSTTKCSTNTSMCATSTVNFTCVSSFSGFTSKYCIESSKCNTTVTKSILATRYTISQRCCSTDKCNPTSSAPFTQLSVSTALCTAVLACFWRQSVN